ncbi:MAG: TolC family protein [Planctomycetota bacterium]|jgi:outer membrane protein
MTVTIARTIVTATKLNNPIQVRRTAGWRAQRAAWLKACSLACGWVCLGSLTAQEPALLKFDLDAEPSAVTADLRSFYGINDWSLTSREWSLASEGLRISAKPENPLRKLATASASPPAIPAKTSLGTEAWGGRESEQPRSSGSGVVLIRDLPLPERQVAQLDGIQLRNLPANQEGEPESELPGKNAEPPELSFQGLPAELPTAVARPSAEIPSETAPRNQALPSRLASEQVAQEAGQTTQATEGQATPEQVTLEQVTPETWWRVEVANPFCGLPQNEPLDLGALIQLTLRGSPYLQAISQEPLVREEDATIARAGFDPVLFARTLYDDRTDPVGNTLTTGGLPFLKDNIWTGQAGIRRKYFTGGKIEASQLLGFQNSNSRFFVPQDQGTATLAINLQQPLLRGAGQTYNRSQIVIAQLNAGASWDQVSWRIQEELARSVSAYWDLYAKRAIYLQMLRNLQRSEAILKRLEARANFDVQALQLAQARAAVTSRRVQLANALRDVRNAETEIRQIVGDTQLIDSDQIELLTVEPPQEVVEPLELSQTVEVALANRPEIREAMNKLKAAAVRNDVTRNEMLPDLSLLFGTYVKGLKGDSALGQAWEQQFVNSTPGYSAGLQYEFPWWNRAATSRNRQNRLEYVRYQNELERATIAVIAETQKGFRTLNSGIETLDSAQIALDAVLAELKQLEVRWDAFPLVEGDWFEGQTQSLLLDQLLAAQQKVTDQEREVTLAELELKRAQINLRRAMGVVLDYYQVNAETSCIDDLPQIEYRTGGTTQPPVSSLPAEDGATAPLREIE